MPKRKDHILVLLTGAPWWVSVLFAVLAYVVLAYIAPIWLIDIGVLGEGLAQMSVKIAPLISLIFLVPALISILRKCN